MYTHILTAMLLFVMATAASAEVLFVSKTGFIIENKIVTQAPPMIAWQALVRDVGVWWPADHTWFGDSRNLTIEARAGGCFCERDAGRSAEHMRISFVQPGKLLRMSGGLGPLQGMGMYGALDWQIAGGEEGTEIRLSYKVSGIDPKGFEALAPIVDKVQAQQLGALGDYLETSDGE